MLPCLGLKAVHPKCYVYLLGVGLWVYPLATSTIAS